MQRTLALLSCTFIVAFTLSAQEKHRVGVLDFVAKGVSETEAQIIGELFRGELVASKHFDVLDRANMDTILEEQEFQVSGCTESECAVKIGRMLNMEYMFYGSVMKLGELFIISVGMVDIESAKIVESAKETFNSIEDAVGAIPEIVDALTKVGDEDTSPVEPEPPKKGTIVIRSKPSGASVTIDRAFKGKTPCTIESDVTKDVSVTLALDGYEKETRRASFVLGEERALDVTLTKVVAHDGNPFRPLVFGGSMCAFASGITLNVLALAGAGDADYAYASYTAATTAVGASSRWDTYQGLIQQNNVMHGVGYACLGVGVGLLAWWIFMPDDATDIAWFLTPRLDRGFDVAFAYSF